MVGYPHDIKGQGIYCYVTLMAGEGIVTLSQTERNLPTIANVDARDFSDLACWLIVQIGPISLNVTTPA